MKITKTIIGIAASAALLGGSAYSLTTQASEPIAPLTPPKVVTVPDETPTVAQAEAWYVTHLGPSLAWRRATPAERQAAEAAYLGEYGSWSNGCEADLHHAFQGTEANPTYVQAGLPVNVISGGVLLGEWVDGVCG